MNRFRRGDLCPLCQANSDGMRSFLGTSLNSAADVAAMTAAKLPLRGEFRVLTGNVSTVRVPAFCYILSLYVYVTQIPEH